ncbi:NB-ARC domain-containing protein [Streptomyces sp. ML-6]|uniref:ATP-binding protein n=1 Tax=Streptomyces sp. ML-6 TaxID=2982693 RepID=UPI0024C07A0C|nr:NB-ARC domain-containing protein [Streptomyces sp. ML-6]MDK0520446.1 NB-ARC domain-containing protein [Streptomyces sp. ML-6]
MSMRSEPEHPAPEQPVPERPAPAGITNSFPGTSDGQLVQAGNVHGGITFNYQAVQEKPAGRRPDQVPRPPRGFVDREEPLAELDDLLGHDDPDGCPIGVFNGLPGIGKTAAACQWAHKNRPRFPGGQLFVDFAGLRAGPGADVSEALARCLRALGVHEPYLPAGLADRTALYRDLSAERRMLVVLDDVTRPAQVTALLPQGPGSAVLATSTWRLGELVLDGAALLQLDVLDDENALELLSVLCGPSRISDEPEAAARLVELCGGLPLALRICAARLVTHRRLTVGALVDELSDEQSRLGRIVVSSAHEERTVSATLELAYRDLPVPAARMYRALGFLPGLSFDTAVAAVAAGLRSADEAQEALDVLETASLLAVMDDRRYVLHGLVRLHARETARTLDPPGTERDTVRRIAGHYLALTTAADHAIRADRFRVPVPADETGTADVPADRTGTAAPAATAASEPFADAADPGPFIDAADPGGAAINWMEAERANILAVLRAASGFGLDRPVWRTAEAFTALFFHHRHLADWRESLELGAEAARRDGNPAAEARLRSLLSRPLLDLGQDDRAKSELDRAEQLAVESGQPVLQASVQEFLGRYWDLHDPARAVDAYRTSLALNTEAGEERGQALAHYFLGRAQSASGDHTTALAALDQAREAFLALRDRRMAARALADTGRVLARQGARVEAVAALSRAADDLNRSEASHYEAQALEDLADLLVDDPDAARRCLRRALAVYEEGGSPRAAEVLARLAPG